VSILKRLIGSHITLRHIYWQAHFRWSGNDHHYLHFVSSLAINHSICLPRLAYLDLAGIPSSLLWIDRAMYWWRPLWDGDSQHRYCWLVKSWLRSSRNSCLMNSMVDDKHQGVWRSYTWDCYRNHTCSWLKFEIFTFYSKIITRSFQNCSNYVSIKQIGTLIEEPLLDRGPTMIEAQSMIEKPSIDRDTDQWSRNPDWPTLYEQRLHVKFPQRQYRSHSHIGLSRRRKIQACRQYALC